jgi:hypothetical protein
MVGAQRLEHLVNFLLRFGAEALDAQEHLVTVRPVSLEQVGNGQDALASRVDSRGVNQVDAGIDGGFGIRVPIFSEIRIAPKLIRVTGRPVRPSFPYGSGGFLNAADGREAGVSALPAGVIAPSPTAAAPQEVALRRSLLVTRSRGTLFILVLSEQRPLRSSINNGDRLSKHM